MAGKKKVNKMKIMEMFVKYRRGIVFDRSLKDIQNPIYATLSDKLKMKRSEIRGVILEMQPSLTLPNCNFEKELLTSTGSSKQNDIICFEIGREIKELWLYCGLDFRPNLRFLSSISSTS